MKHRYIDTSIHPSIIHPPTRPYIPTGPYIPTETKTNKRRSTLTTIRVAHGTGMPLLFASAGRCQASWLHDPAASPMVPAESPFLWWFYFTFLGGFFQFEFVPLGASHIMYWMVLVGLPNRNCNTLEQGLLKFLVAWGTQFLVNSNWKEFLASTPRKGDMVPLTLPSHFGQV